MLKKMFLPFMFIALLAVVPAFANIGCKNGKFVGTYTLPTLDNDIFGDGSVVHSHAFQLTLHSDGISNLYWTGFNDYFINAGTGSPYIGSWTCRTDGKLVVSLLSAVYLPSIPSGNAPSPDVRLVSHRRTTLLFEVEDINTLRRIQGRNRSYNPSQDPTDPNGGTLGALSTTVTIYKRFVASDADLLAP